MYLYSISKHRVAYLRRHDMDKDEIKQEKRAERTQIMTPKEAAKYLGFHLVTIYRLLKKQMVPAIKIGGQWRFKKDILDSWLLKRMNEKRPAAES